MNSTSVRRIDEIGDESRRRSPDERLAHAEALALNQCQ